MLKFHTDLILFYNVKIFIMTMFITSLSDAQKTDQPYISVSGKNSTYNKAKIDLRVLYFKVNTIIKIKRLQNHVFDCQVSRCYFGSHKIQIKISSPIR